MTNSLLQDRLRDHAKAFDGLLSLIPAKIYYGDDKDNQGDGRKKKKKRAHSKNEAAAIRRTKFDPDNKLNQNAKEVMDEKARKKRKLAERQQADNEEGDGTCDDDDDNHVMEGIVKETPGQGIKKSGSRSKKKQKLNDDLTNKLRVTRGNEDANPCAPPHKKKGETRTKRERMAAVAADSKLGGPLTQDSDGQCLDAERKNTSSSIVSQLSTTPPPSTSKPSEAISSHITLDTSTSSDSLDNVAVAPAMAPTISATSPKQVKVATANMDALRARLSAKIEALRAARKADGTNDRPIRTRQELIESRRAKQAQRKAHKLELRRQAKLEEEQKREETLVSNSPMSPSLDIDDDTRTGSLSFGRVSFKDGTRLSHDLSRVLAEGKKKGPSDPKTALIKLQNRKKRLESMDKDTREDVQMNDAWLAAKRQVLGEKVVSEPTLKKTIKRKEQAKKKSEHQWRDRIKTANHVSKEQQRKREENIQKRKDEKLLGKAGKKKGAPSKKNARPGFEGNLGLRGKKKR